MVEIAFAPGGVRPTLLLEIQVLDPVALGREHLAQVGGRGLDLFQILGVMFFDGLGHGLLRFAVRFDPTQLRRTRTCNYQLDAELAQPGAPHPHLLQAVSRDGDLLDLL